MNGKVNSIKSQDSIKSKKSKDSFKKKQDSIKRRVDKYNEEVKQYKGEKEDVYNERRRRKEEKKKQLERDSRLRVYKCLYWPSLAFALCGCCFIFGATIRSISEGSFIWENRHVFRIVGPILTALGLISLMTVNALVSRHAEHVKRKKEEEIRTRKEALRKRILQRYLRKENEMYNNFKRHAVSRTISATSSATCQTIEELEESQYITNKSNQMYINFKRPVSRTISAASSATCHTIDELDDSQYFSMNNGMLSTANLHPFWTPTISKQKSSEAYSWQCQNYLESSQNSTTESSQNSTAESTQNSTTTESSQNSRTPLLSIHSNDSVSIDLQEELSKIKFIDETE